MSFAENIKKLGSHSIQLNVVLNESGVYTFAGIKLPSLLIKFNVVGRLKSINSTFVGYISMYFVKKSFFHN